MDFTNETFDTGLLPKAEDVPFTPVERSYLTVIRIEWAISSAILLVIGIILIVSIPVLQRPLWISLIAGAWILITLLYFFLQNKSFIQKAYALRDKDLIYRSGWI